VTRRGGTGPRGPASATWKGGRTTTPGGYVGICLPDHPRAAASGFVLEHIVIAERALGKPLTADHPVHHVDENPANNANTNLVICQSHAYHKLLHQRQRAFDACGDANARRCVRCKRYDNQDDMRVYATSASHAACNRAHVAKYARTKAEANQQMIAESATAVGA
jgi:hypothetical protein